MSDKLRDKLRASQQRRQQAIREARASKGKPFVYQPELGKEVMGGLAARVGLCLEPGCRNSSQDYLFYDGRCAECEARRLREERLAKRAAAKAHVATGAFS